MLDFVYYPVSAILWFWHRAFGAILGPDSGVAWALAVVFLVVTVRLVLLKPVVSQLRTARTMRDLAPRLRALQHDHAGDRQRQAVEMRKLQREHGVAPWLGCLPMLVQIPVFLALFHVLRSFDRTGTGWGQLGLSAEVNAVTPHYVFGAAEVRSFLGARLFGAPISAAVASPDSIPAAFGGVPGLGVVAAVAIPLMVVAAVATHVSARVSIARQGAAPTPQTALMNRLMLWVLPLGVLVAGPILPISILLYWVGNTVWTCAQQHLVFARLDREEANAPAPGARPARWKRNERR